MLPTKEFLETWIRTLESGQYMKGRKRLRTGSDPQFYGYCCLGVAAHMEGDMEEGGTVCSPELTLENGFTFRPRHLTAFLPDGMYGLSTEVQNELSSINDTTDTFAEVIAHIRETYKDVLAS